MITMASTPIAIQRTGLVTSIGLSAPAACAAMRAKLANPTKTDFIGDDGKAVMAHEVTLDRPWRGLGKLARMAAMAIEECLGDVPRKDWACIPVLLCVAENERSGRLDGLDDGLFAEIEKILSTQFAGSSTIIPHGRVGAAVALSAADGLLRGGTYSRVLVAGVDSLLSWPSLQVYERDDRLLKRSNSNGFIPGEAAGALLLGRRDSKTQQLCCHGLGFGVENAHVTSGQPLRADGMAAAIKEALANAGCEMHDIDFRITDLSGEQYYFKEAALALSRTLRKRKPEFDLWHPAESTGETGAASGILVLAVADAACRKGYAPGPNIIAHLANDGGRRAAAILRFWAAP